MFMNYIFMTFSVVFERDVGILFEGSQESSFYELVRR